MGGLVHSMDQPLHIALVAKVFDHSDNLVSASLFGRLSGYFGNLKHNKQKTVPI